MVANAYSTNHYIQEASAIALANGITESPLQQAALFMQNVWQAIPNDEHVGLMLAGEYVNRESGDWTTNHEPRWITAGAAKSGYFSPNVQELLKWAHDQNRAYYHKDGQGSIYWNAASRKPYVATKFNARGGLTDLLNVGALWADFDTGKVGTSLTDAVSLVLQHSLLTPAFIIATGGGLQVVWTLSEPWNVTDKALADEFSNYAREFLKSLANIPALNWDTGTLDASREVRIPGFVNCKPSRGGMIAQIIYHSPTAYSIDQIKALVTLPPEKVREPRPLLDKLDGEYQVIQQFVNLLVRGGDLPIGVNRHDLLLEFALNAASGGIPREVLTAVLRRAAELWYAHDTDRSDAPYGELDNAVNWAYDTADLKGPYGGCLVKITSEGLFEEIERESRTHVIGDTPLETPRQDILTVEEIRLDMPKALERFLSRDKGNIPQALLISAAPGVGKSYLIWNTIREITAQGKRVIIFLPYKITDLSSYLTENKVDDLLAITSLYIARNNNKDASGQPLNRGYCNQPEIVNNFAEKGYRTKEVCDNCALGILGECQLKHYLSQKRHVTSVDSNDAQILICTHEQAITDELFANRDLVIFDEDFEDVVLLRYLAYSLDDLTPRNESTMPGDENPFFQEINNILSVMRNAVSMIPTPKKGGVPDNTAVKLGGYWLVDQVVRVIGKPRLDALAIELDRRELSIEETPSTGGLLTAAMPLIRRFVLTDYRDHYLTGSPAWNSLIIPMPGGIRFYPTIKVKPGSKRDVILLDATGDPVRYERMLETVSGESFEILQYKPSLVQKSPRIVVMGTDNAKRSLDLDEVEIEKGIAGGKKEPPAIIRLKRYLLDMRDRYGDAVLVISYQALIKHLKVWGKDNGMNPDNFIYFQGVGTRGGNKWGNVKAVLMFGTPRIPLTETLIRAQVLYADDPMPISAEREPIKLQYPGYVDPVTGNAAYYVDTVNHQPTGFVDKRVEAVYIQDLQAEMIQNIGRGRVDTSDKTKFVFIHSGFPTGENVDKIVSFNDFEIDQAIRNLLDVNETTTQADVVRQLASQYDKEAIRRNYSRILNELEATGEYIRIAVRNPSGGRPTEGLVKR